MVAYVQLHTVQFPHLLSVCFSGGGRGCCWQGEATGRPVQRRDAVRTERRRNSHGRAETRTARRGQARIQDAQTSRRVTCIRSHTPGRYALCTALSNLCHIQHRVLFRNLAMEVWM